MNKYLKKVIVITLSLALVFVLISGCDKPTASPEEVAIDNPDEPMLSDSNDVYELVPGEEHFFSI